MKKNSTSTSIIFLTSLNQNPYEYSTEFLRHINKACLLNSNSAAERFHLSPGISAALNLNLNPIGYSLSQDHSIENKDLIIPKICVVTKLTMRNKRIHSIADANLKAIRYFKSKGCKIVVVYCDNWCEYQGDDELMNCAKDLYLNLLHLADYIITPSKALSSRADIIKGKESRSIIIEDPTQIQRKKFQNLKKDSECKLIWFGNQANLYYLKKELPSILSSCNAANYFELTILSNSLACKNIIDFLPRLKCNKNWKYRIVKWQLSRLEDELSRAHISLIPSDINSPFKSVVSHNRAVDSIQGGCMVIASPLQSYIELKDCLLLGNDFPQLINYGIQNYNKFIKDWSLKREKLIKCFEPKENLKKWEDCFNNILLDHK